MDIRKHVGVETGAHSQELGPPGTLGSMAGYDVNADPGRIDMDVVWSYLHREAYWGRGRSRADVEKQVEGAWRVVGAYAEDGTQVGFARAVSDGVAFAYLADVFV